MIYKISLKPLGSFYFGGDNKFNDVRTAADARRDTYLLRSRMYPQQTSLLGLIRNQLLLQNGLLTDNSAKISDQETAKLLIGVTGFQLNADRAYGVIERISPVFFSDADGAEWIPAPLDDLLMEGKKMELTAKAGQTFLNGYKEKIGLNPCVVAAADTKNRIETADLFCADERVGITKATKPWNTQAVPENDKAYYYQTFFKFSKAKAHFPNRFSFYLQCNANKTFAFKTEVVEMGGERSTFLMEVESTTLEAMPQLPSTSYVHTTRDNPKFKTLLCLSPAKVDINQLRAMAEVICSVGVSFRFLSTTIGVTENYQRRDMTGKSKTESQLYQLLDRGSVIHFDEKNLSAIKKLFNQADLFRIGYNAYQII
jgi:CRISPR-associated protein Cmr3